MMKINKKLSAVILMMFVTISLINIEVNAAPKDVKKVSITSIKTKKLIMNRGTAKTLNVKITTSKKKTSKAFTVKSSNKNVVKVVKSGQNIKLTALDNGISTITVTSKANKAKKCTLKVTVVTPVTGIKLNNTSVSDYAGTKVNLTATVAPATASNKNVIWTSSNNNLATVSDGVVTLKSAGTVVISAKSAENSAIVAKCTIDIKEPNYIKSMEYVSATEVMIELSKPQYLTYDKFEVLLRSSKRAEYICTAGIIDISSNDNRIYTLVFKDQYLLGRYMRINISGLEGVYGVANKEIRLIPKVGSAYESTDIYRIQISDSYYNGVYYTPKEMYGYYSITYSDIPDNMEVVNYGDNILVKRFLNILGYGEFVFTAKDEYGHVSKRKIVHMVYDSEHIYGYLDDVYGLIKGEQGYSVNKKVSAYGGSGTYAYEIVGETHGLTVDTNGYVKGTILKPGDYKVRVKITDATNSYIYTYVDFTIHIKQGVLLKGTVKDILKQGVYYASVRVENVDANNKYSNVVTAYSNKDGEYSTYVIPGTYTLKVHTDGATLCQYFYNVKVTDKGLTYNVQMPHYKINVNIDSTRYSNVTYWYNSNDINFGYNNTIYLKEGRYLLRARATRKSDGEYVTLMIKVNVTGEMTTTPTEMPYEER